MGLMAADFTLINMSVGASSAAVLESCAGCCAGSGWSLVKDIVKPSRPVRMAALMMVCWLMERVFV